MRQVAEAHDAARGRHIGRALQGAAAGATRRGHHCAVVATPQVTELVLNPKLRLRRKGSSSRRRGWRLRQNGELVGRRRIHGDTAGGCASQAAAVEINRDGFCLIIGEVREGSQTIHGGRSGRSLQRCRPGVARRGYHGTAVGGDEVPKGIFQAHHCCCRKGRSCRCRGRWLRLNNELCGCAGIDGECAAHRRAQAVGARG